MIIVEEFIKIIDEHEPWIRVVCHECGKTVEIKPKDVSHGDNGGYKYKCPYCQAKNVIYPVELSDRFIDNIK